MSSETETDWCKKINKDKYSKSVFDYGPGASFAQMRQHEVRDLFRIRNTGHVRDDDVKLKAWMDEHNIKTLQELVDYCKGV